MTDINETSERHLQRLAIIGSGVVGQATGRGFIARGHSLVFVDTDPETLSGLRALRYDAIPASELPLRKDIDVYMLCVPTPTGKSGPDISALCSAASQVGEGLQTSSANYPIIGIRSTVPVGTLSEVIVSLIEQKSGGKAGVDFGVFSNPEYLRAHCADMDFNHPRVIIIGCDDDKTAQSVRALYAPFDVPITLLRSREAEMHKYLHNVYNASKISIFNEFRSLCQLATIDPDVVFPVVVKSSEASWNPEYGIRDFGPFAGTCLPKDTEGLYLWAKARGMAMPLLESVMRVNNALAGKRRK